VFSYELSEYESFVEGQRADRIVQQQPPRFLGQIAKVGPEPRIRLKQRYVGVVAYSLPQKRPAALVGDHLGMLKQARSVCAPVSLNLARKVRHRVRFNANAGDLVLLALDESRARTTKWIQDD
jgi:hypothetical protein